MIRKITICLLLAFALLKTALAKDIYVSVMGNDNNTGTLVKPFATIQKAQIEARRYHEKTVIYIRSGSYYLSSPVTFTNADSRSKDAELTIKAYPNEHPVISSARVLKLDWKPLPNGIYYANVKDTATIFDQLFVNGKPMVMARYPNYHEGILPYGGTAADAISPERSAKWNNPTGAFVHAMHNSLWGDMGYLVTGKDAAGKLMLQGGWQNNRVSAMHNKYRFVENVREELDTLNEWYYDKQEHRLYYKPAPNVNLKNALVLTPQLESLLIFKGTKDNPVQYITIEGLTLTHTLRTFMKTREPLLRSDWCIYRGGAVFFQGAAHINITNCNLKYLGGNAAMFSNYNRYNTIAGCQFDHVGASGVVFVGDPAAVRSAVFNYQTMIDPEKTDTVRGPKTDNYPRYCTVTDNLIHQIGEVEKQTAGVQLSMCRDIAVSHNSIYDVPRAGINCNEGTWGGHVISYNDVFNTVLETGDHGAFNSWGRDRYWFPKRAFMDSLLSARPQLALLDVVEPIQLLNNRFRCDNGWDIDLDDGSSNYIIKNNVCLNGGIKLREGFNRVVENNIMINNSFHPHVWFKNSHDSFEHNIVTAAYQPIRIADWGQQIDHNLFPDEAALAKAHTAGTDKNSAFGNPVFTNASAGDYSVKSNSPALAIGFKNIDLDFGVTSARLKAIAKKPVIPQVMSVQLVSGEEVDFFKLKVKNLETLAEQSATGMAEKRGVFVVNSTPASLLYPNIKANDVILAFAGEKVNNIHDLFNARLKVQFSKSAVVVIFRDQHEQTITVNIK